VDNLHLQLYSLQSGCIFLQKTGCPGYDLSGIHKGLGMSSIWFSDLHSDNLYIIQRKGKIQKCPAPPLMNSTFRHSKAFLFDGRDGGPRSCFAQRSLRRGCLADGLSEPPRGFQAGSMAPPPGAACFSGRYISFFILGFHRAQMI
jgi:hypothetical protein